MTVRQLEALIRLSEAIARSHLERVVLPAHVRLAVKLLKTSIISVESSEVDLSDFQDAEDGTNVPSESDAGQPAEEDAAPQQQGAENDQAADNGKKKLVITEEHFQRVTQALVMRLRQHEESVKKDGDGLAGMKQGDLIIWYVEQQNAKGAYSSTAEVKEEVKCIKAIIERLIQREGHLIVIDEGTAAAAEDGSGARRTSESRILAVNPNYVID
ncbi:Minichromosome maintenance protein [Zea mays]|nr:Minichromosome maintenance protein [Zea mays]